jgi:inner membrane protease subunit 1
MLTHTARRLAARLTRAPPPLRPYAPTPPKPKATPGVKTQITKAFTDPAPPVLARWPTVYYPVQVFLWGTGICLGWHIWSEYFFSFNEAEGISMAPTIYSSGDWLLLSKKYRRGRGVEVGDIVSYKHPIDVGTFGVKRIVGMPGDFVLRDTPETSGLMIQVSGLYSDMNTERELIQVIQVPEGHCWIVGDNLTWSRDSRIFGPLPLALIKAKVIGRLSTFGKFEWDGFSDDGIKPYDYDRKDEDDDVD